MFKIGERVMYGSSGVCTVEKIAPIEKNGKDYYTLKPCFSSETIYAPVDTKVFMRRALNQNEAMELVRNIPEIEGERCNEKNFIAIREYYQKSFETHECEDLIQLIKGVFEKGMNGKLGVVDQRYMKRAEDLLYGELAVALGIERDEVVNYIKNTIDGKNN